MPDLAVPFPPYTSSPVRDVPVGFRGFGTRAEEAYSLAYLGNGSLPRGPEDRASGTLRLFDADGRLVRNLATGQGRPRWDGLDAAGRPVRQGVLLLRFEPDDKRAD